MKQGGGQRQRREQADTNRPNLLGTHGATALMLEEVSSTAFDAQPLDLHSVPLMD